MMSKFYRKPIDALKIRLSQDQGHGCSSPVMIAHPIESTGTRMKYSTVLGTLPEEQYGTSTARICGTRYLFFLM